MPVDDRLRIGLAANAETMTPGVERNLEAVQRHRRRDVRLRWAAVGGTVAAATVGVLLAIVPGSPPDTAEPVDTPPAPSGSESAYGGPRIPDGDWSKVATTAEARRRGLDMRAVREHLGVDGRMPVTLRFDGDQITVLVTEDDGLTTPGDQGTVSYDAQGRLVWVSESPGCPGCVSVQSWSVDGGMLTLRFVSGARQIEDDERLIVAGTFRRVRD